MVRVWLASLVYLLAVFATVGAGCSDSASQVNSISLFSAASTIDSVTDIADRFEQQANFKVKTNFAGSATLAMQIVNGATVDLFLSADRVWIEEVRLVDPKLRFRKVVENQLVLVGSKRLEKTGWIPNSLNDLLDERVHRICLGDPDSVPAGKYAKQSLQTLDLWDSINNKVVNAANVRQVLAQIETGAAEVGFLYRTDAEASENVFVVCSLEKELTGPIEYYLAITESGQSNEGALALYEYFFEQEAQAIFSAFEFLVSGHQ